MKLRYLKVKNWLLMTVMGLFGLTACHSAKNVAKDQDPAAADPQIQQPDPRNEIALMYGVPTMDFTVKGRVIDGQGKPVDGMQVVLLNQNIDITPDNMHDDNPRVRQYLSQVADTTDAQGQFSTTVSDVPVTSQRLIVRDIDGDKNGYYEDQIIDVIFTEGDQTKPREGWYQGAREKDVDITVEPKR